SARASQRPAMTVVLLLVGVALGIAGYRIVATSSNAPALAQTPGRPASLLPLVREGQRITVLPGSPLRNKLTIEAVGEKEIQRTLILPAVVEADPARLVKVLPPLS